MGYSPWGRPESDTRERRQQQPPPPSSSFPCLSDTCPVWCVFSIFLTLVPYLSPPTSIRSPGEEGVGLVHDFTLNSLCT